MQCNNEIAIFATTVSPIKNINCRITVIWYVWDVLVRLLVCAINVAKTRKIIEKNDRYIDV